MWYNGSAWAYLGTPGFSSGLGRFTSIAVNSNGIPFVAYSDGGAGNRLTVMKWNGASWVSVGGTGVSAGEADWISMTIDAENDLYVVFEDFANNGKATLMEYNGTKWATVGNVGFSPGKAVGTTLLINNGVPYVAFSDAANGGKATVMKYSGSWQTVGSPGFTPGTAEYISLAVNTGNSHLYVSFSDWSVNSLPGAVMGFDGTNWGSYTNTYYYTGDEDQCTSLFVNNGNLFVAQYEDAMGGITVQSCPCP